MVLFCVFSVSVWKFRFSTVNYTTTANKHTVCNSQLPEHLVIWGYVTLGHTRKKKTQFVAWYIKHFQICIWCADGDIHCEFKSLMYAENYFF